jgi:hypothetical protein
VPSSPVKKPAAAPISRTISKAPVKKAAAIGSISSTNLKAVAATGGDGKRIKELEERVRELEALVAQLRSENEMLRNTAGN